MSLIEISKRIKNKKDTILYFGGQSCAMWAVKFKFMAGQV
jgi:hypothetical protein